MNKSARPIKKKKIIYNQNETNKQINKRAIEQKLHITHGRTGIMGESHETRAWKIL